MVETASVEILVDAITQSAEDAVDDVGDQLQNLSVKSQPAQAALDEVADDLDDAATSAFAAGAAFEATDGRVRGLGRAMSMLARNADDAGDEMLGAGAKAGVTSGLFTALSVSTDGLNLSFGRLGTTTTLLLVPALVALLTVLFPLAAVAGTIAAAFGGVAAAFALIAGTGIVAGFDRLKNALEGAKQSLRILADTFGKQFVPLLLDAIQALPELFRRILAAVGSLDQFVDALRSLGGLALDAIPALVGALVDLGERALPLIMDGVRFLTENGGDILDGMVETTERVGPTLMNLAEAFVAATPALTDFGSTVLNDVVPPLTAFFNAIAAGGAGDLERLQDALNLSDRSFRALRRGVEELVAGVEALMPLLTTLAAEFEEHALPAIGAFLNVVGRLAQAFGSLPIAAQKAALIGLLAVIGILGGPIAAVAAALGIMTLAFDPLMDAIDGVLGFLDMLARDFHRKLVVPAAEAARFLVTGLPQAIVRGLTAALVAIQSWVAQVRTAFVNVFNAVVRIVGAGLQAAVDTAVRALNDYLAVLDQVAATVDALPGADLPEIGQVQSPDIQTAQFRAEQRQFDRRRAQERSREALEVALQVDGDGKLSEIIRDSIDVERRRQRRETRRQNVTGVSR